MKGSKRVHQVTVYEFTARHVVNALKVPYGSKLRLHTGVDNDGKPTYIELGNGDDYFPRLVAVHETIPSYKELDETPVTQREEEI